MALEICVTRKGKGRISLSPKAALPNECLNNENVVPLIVGLHYYFVALVLLFSLPK
jgi:hypothetical protein